MSSNDINSRLATLRAAYYARLPDELAQLRQLAAALPDPSQQSQALEQLHQRFHRLAGSAGSFGLGELGKLARQLEKQTQLWLQHLPTDPELFTQLDAAIASCSQWLAPEQLPRLASQALASSSGGSLIYVLEDDLQLAEELCITLRHFGHEVHHFNRLAEAERQLLARPPGLLICDIVFTQEGREAPAAIAALQARLAQPVPVIFMSTRDDFHAYHAAVRAGAVGYFVKPLDIIRLVDCFEYYLDPNRSSPYRVLVVDDDPMLGEHYCLILGAANIRAEYLHKPDRIFDVLEDFHPELILLDINMPSCSGPELAQVIRLNPDWLRVPITYLSAESDLDKRLLAMGRAGDDFLPKHLSERELVSAVSMRAARCRQLSYTLDRDSLSGLLKHSRIKELVEAELTRAQRRNTPVSLVMLDLDHFKQVNDTYGHSMGDKVIKAMAHLLRQRLRKTDAIGRYGGEEFLMVLPDCGSEEALNLINNVRSHFHELGFQHQGQSFKVTASAGIATYRGGEANSDLLLQAADDALYQAKRQGRDQVCVYS